jgi:two-component system, OmpR family, response regulator MprA
MRKIIIVDDEFDLARSIQHILRDEGFDATALEQSADIVERVLKSKPDAVVLDLMMPFMSGFEMIERLRSAQPGLPIILMSPLDVSAAAQHVTFLKKPFTAERLLTALGELRRDPKNQRA